jgi:hypothetical protein
VEQEAVAVQEITALPHKQILVLEAAALVALLLLMAQAAAVQVDT